MLTFIKRLAIDSTPLRVSRDFRNLWLSSLISSLGTVFTYVAMPYQLKEITGSYIAVGILGLVEIIPLVIFGLYGGALADALDRRKMVILTEMSFLLITSLLAFNSSNNDPQVWLIYLAGILQASVNGLQRPSKSAIIPRVVPREHLAAASAWQSLTYNFSHVAGTAIAGVLVVTAGTTFAYIIDAFSFVVSIFLFTRLSPISISDKAIKPDLRGILEGAQYAWQRKDLLGTYLIDTIAMVFAYPSALFPFLADAYAKPESLGLLYSAGAVGALLATVTSGWTNNIKRHGLAVILAACGWGVGIAIVGFGNSLTIALIGLTLAGAADMISATFRQVIWNTTIPDELRGRLAGIELLSYSIGPQLGQVRASVTAQTFGLRTAFTSGGILCIALVGATAQFLPTLRKYRDAE